MGHLTRPAGYSLPICSWLGQLSLAGLFISWKYNPSLLCCWIGVYKKILSYFSKSHSQFKLQKLHIIPFLKQIMIFHKLIIYFGCFPFRCPLCVLTRRGPRAAGLGSFLSREERLEKSEVSRKWTDIGDTEDANVVMWHHDRDHYPLMTEKKHNFKKSDTEKLAGCHFVGSLARPGTSLNQISSR